MYEKYMGKKIKIENIHSLNGKNIDNQVGVIKKVEDDPGGGLIVSCNIGKVKYYLYVKDKERLNVLIM